jgi:GntR family transcriptional regulator/MocR family aminotransferase
MRTHYRRRRDLLIEALADALPQATIRGIAAGLHATVELPAEYDERAILDEAHARRIDLTTMGEFWIGPDHGAPTLLIGYGQIREPAIRTAVDELSDAVHATAPVGS